MQIYLPEAVKLFHDRKAASDFTSLSGYIAEKLIEEYKLATGAKAA